MKGQERAASLSLPPLPTPRTERNPLRFFWLAEMTLENGN